MKNIIINALLTLGVLINGKATAQESHQVNTGVLDSVQVWLSQNKVPAAGVVLIENGKLKAARVYGTLHDDVRAKDNSIFEIASVSKTVTTMIVLKLVSASKWDLDEPLSHYWVDPDVADDPRSRKLTTRHVLSQSTGFVNWRGSKKLRFTFDPGTKWQYSGEGLEYLRKALEKKFHRGFEQLAEEVLFNPLHMNETHYIWTAQIGDRYAVPHDYNLKAYQIFKPEIPSAASNVLTTVNDMAKFGEDVLRGGELSKKVYADMTRKQMRISDETDQGLGFRLVKDLPNGEFALVHTGGDEGVRTILVLLPKSKRGVIVLTNGDNGTIVYNNILSGALDAGKTLIRNLDAPSYHPDTTKVVAVPDNLMESYAGQFASSPTNILTVTNEGKRLKIKTPGGEVYHGYPQSQNLFFGLEEDMQYEFVKDEKGETNKMIIHYFGELPEFNRVK